MEGQNPALIRSPAIARACVCLFSLRPWAQPAWISDSRGFPADAVPWQTPAAEPRERAARQGDGSEFAGRTGARTCSHSLTRFEGAAPFPWLCGRVRICQLPPPHSVLSMQRFLTLYFPYFLASSSQWEAPTRAQITGGEMKSRNSACWFLVPIG